MTATGLDATARQEIAELLTRYATGVDRRDWALFRTCFTEDCDIEYPDIGFWHSAHEITEWMREIHEPCGHTMHRITNQAVTSVDDTVRASSYVDAIIMGADNLTGVRDGVDPIASA